MVCSVAMRIRWALIPFRSLTPIRTSMTKAIPALAALGALTNAFVWGLSWMPLRWLEARGLSSLWVTTFVFALCSLGIAIARPHSPLQFLRNRKLWWLAFGAGMTNACFNTALVTGDVVRAVLLFYLMPVWVVLLARWLVHERITGAAVLRIAIALVGAALVLGQGALVLPIPRTIGDALAVAGGFAFGLNNVLLRKFNQEPAEARAFSIFIGGVLLPPIAIALLALLGKSTAWPSANAITWMGLAAFALAVVIANLALQYGAARLTANVLSIIMVSEVLFAAVTTVLFDGAVLTPYTIAGGCLIIAASLMAVFQSHAP
jgi:drug/metabolite transporter (DMT)-like permease